MSGLSREQLDMCYKANDVTIAALEGLDLAIRECQFQVKYLCVRADVDWTLADSVPHTRDIELNF